MCAFPFQALRNIDCMIYLMIKKLAKNIRIWIGVRVRIFQIKSCISWFLHELTYLFKLVRTQRWSWCWKTWKEKNKSTEFRAKLFSYSMTFYNNSRVSVIKQNLNLNVFKCKSKLASKWQKNEEKNIQRKKQTNKIWAAKFVTQSASVLEPHMKVKIIKQIIDDCKLVEQFTKLLVYRIVLLYC